MPPAASARPASMTAAGNSFDLEDKLDSNHRP